MYLTFIIIHVTLVHVSALTSINLTIPNLTDDDWLRIDAEKARLLTDIDDFVHIGPNEFGSSIGGSTLTANSDDEEDGGIPNVDDESSDDDVIVLRFNANNNDDGDAINERRGR